jgi:hypothetical protein
MAEKASPREAARALEGSRRVNPLEVPAPFAKDGEEQVKLKTTIKTEAITPFLIFASKMSCLCNNYPAFME